MPKSSMEKTKPAACSSYIRRTGGFIGKEAAFGQFQFQQVVGQVVGVHKVDDFAGQVGVVKVQARNVDRNGHGLVALVQPAAQCAAGLVPDIFVQPYNKAVAFKQGDEAAGQDEAVSRVGPAHQGFGPDDAPAGNFHLGLEIELELLFFQCGVHLVGNIGFVVQSFAQGVVVKGKAAEVAALDGFLRQVGPVAEHMGRGAAVFYLADAEKELDPERF